MPEPTPTYTQFASPDLIEAIVYGGHDAGDDPNWPGSGAPDQAEYATWCRHMCGVACLATALHHLDGRTPALFDLLAGCRKHGAYTVDADGEIHGLIYDPFAAYVRAELGLDATVHRHLPVAGLLAELDRGSLVMASVHKEIRRPDGPAPGRGGGHLVLATAHDGGDILFRNPSGHTPAARTARLPAGRFADFYAERGIALRRAAVTG